MKGRVTSTLEVASGGPGSCCGLYDGVESTGLKCCAGAFFIQKENGFFVSVKKSATSLNYELLMLLEEHKLLCQGTLKRNITRNYLLSEAPIQA